MPKTNTTSFMTFQSSRIPVEIPTKTSPSNKTRHSWLTVVIGLIAVVGILGIVVVSIISFVILRPNTTTKSTSTTTTSTTTSAVMCYTPPSPRQSNIWLRVDSMVIPRVYHTSTFVSQDNTVLITGGTYATVISASVQKYIPSTGCFQTMRDMPRARQMHTSDQLPSFSDYIIITGGIAPAVGALNIADFYHPVTGDTITVTGLPSIRYLHSSTVLSSSQIVLIGGYASAGVILNTNDMLNTATSSVFVAGTNTMTQAHVYHTATLLGNNSDLVLVAGGFNGGILTAAYLYHGSANAFISLGPGVVLSPARYAHAATYIPSPINKVLITGGLGGVVYGLMTLFNILPYTFTTLTTSLIYPRYHHTSTLLPNGKILIVGGYNGSSMSSCELIDPSNNYTVTLADNLFQGRYWHTTTLIPDSYNGTVLVCGGYSPPSIIINDCEIYYV